MFGLLDIGMCSLEKVANRHYTCGVCDALAAGYGVTARPMLSRDAVFLSLLTSAQMGGHISNGPMGPVQSARKCRPWSRAGPTAPEFAYPATASVVAYCGLLMDRLHDEPSFLSSIQYALCRKRMASASARLEGFGLGLPMGELVARQHSIEESGSHEYSRVTESIYSALFSHSAVVAGMPGNAPGLAEVGMNVGRMAYLLDGYIDAEQDRKRGSFNACTAMASVLGISGLGRLRGEVKSRAKGSLEAIGRAMSTVRLWSHDAQIRRSLTEGLRSRVDALMSLTALANSRPKRLYIFGLAPLAIFMVKGLAGASQGDDYCCNTDCLTCGITEEDCCAAAMPPGSDVPTGAIAAAGIGGVGAAVGAGIGILASGVGAWGSTGQTGTTGGTPETLGTATQPPPEFMQQWGQPPRPTEPYPKHNWVDWRDDWYDASEENQRLKRGITPGEELKEILEARPPWMNEYDYPAPDDTEFYRKYGRARYLSDEEVGKLPPDRQAEYRQWKQRYSSWQRRNFVESEFVSVCGSRG
jgi:hypothetical protein